MRDEYNFYYFGLSKNTIEFGIVMDGERKMLQNVGVKIETDKWYRVFIDVTLSVYIAYVFEETDIDMKI